VDSTAFVGVTRNRQSPDRAIRIGAPNYYGDVVVRGTVSYEFDFWGRVRNEVVAGKAQAQAVSEEAASARLSLEARLGPAYMDLRGADAQEALLADTTVPYARALALTKAKHDGGAVSRLDVGRAEAQLESTRAQQVDVAAPRALDEHLTLITRVRSRSSNAV
jgi:outer membrane protein TolC